MNVWAPKRLGTKSYVRQINITFWVVSLRDYYLRDHLGTAREY